MIDQEFSLDHVGWITKDVDQFEAFWCDNLGFELVFESFLDKERALGLFGLETSGDIRRYQRGAMVIEIHHLDCIADAEQVFNRFGLNHIALHVEDREAFLSELDETIPVHRLQNRGGWYNLFIRDFEGNWIELRESLTPPDSKE